MFTKICSACGKEKSFYRSFNRGQSRCHSCLRKNLKYKKRFDPNSVRVKDRYRICLVTQCRACNSMMRDTFTEQLLSTRTGKVNAWGRQLYDEIKHNGSLYSSQYNLCVKCCESKKREGVFVEIYRCGICGLLGSARKVKRKTDYWWPLFDDVDIHMAPDFLCVGCGKKAEKLSSMHMECMELQKLINKLNREISHARKNAVNG